jgi:UDP-N-acetylmuramyl pentapeptide phosphotransferase/UDP-N-acetylglucosamine-1-phosphate transferase
MSFIVSIVVSFLMALCLCVLATHLLLDSRVSQLIVDRPNHRSLHTNTKPRTGGLGIALALILSIFCLLFASLLMWEVIANTFVVYLLLVSISLVDDVKPVSAKVRLSVHVALITIWVLSQYSGSWLFTVVLILGITWALNLYNFMDGSDGLAGGITIPAFVAYSLAAFLANDPSVAILSAVVCGAALGFLHFNWPPAKVFLGDSGSIPLGFLAAATGTIGVIKDYWQPTFPLMLFAMFWVDATYTLVRRALRREKVWQAHNEHWYQKAIRAGNSHRKILLIHLVCNIVIAGLALLSTLSPTFATPLVHVLTIGAVIAIAFGFGVWAESQFRGFQAKQIK